ncbi:hypothetical protein SCLCIDRAFT_946703 [Scleroderma citrinum Foug A]|uniref:Uncharacterized protein n=1 Tax=Scleroderma citrinum Foug A TaxID=1036808 RepID=A0A0C3DVY9_9AGAM|nr:hypothetical protein SCLCIDRAFT_946703 [Scleroderma citrinum Foug A]
MKCGDYRCDVTVAPLLAPEFSGISTISHTRIYLECLCLLRTFSRITGFWIFAGCWEAWSAVLNNPQVSMIQDASPYQARVL